MNYTYREIPEDERATFHDVVTYAFRPEGGPPEYDPDDLREGAKLGEMRGLYDDEGDLTVVCRHHWFRTRVRGQWLETPGLSAVASPPEHRHKGLVADLLRESLSEYRERDSTFSILWPFKYAFYRKYGWETTNRMAQIEMDPDALSFTEASATGEFHEADPDEWETLQDVYLATWGHRELVMDRTEEWWRHRIFEGWRTDPFVYRYERDGETAGYVVYLVQEEDDGKRMDVYDFGAVDVGAYLNCLRFAYYHESQVDRVRIYDHPDADLLDLAPNPEDLDVTLVTAAMARLVDVRRLEDLGYPADVDDLVVVAVDDPLVDWNDDSFALDVTAGEATVTRVDAAPDVETDVGTLSTLALGYRSAEWLADVGRIEGSSEAVAALGRAFPPSDVGVGEGF